MKVGIIGSGNVGAALGKRLLEAGHGVRWGVRDTTSAKAVKLLAALPTAHLVPTEECLGWADAILITTPANAAPSLVPALAQYAAGKVVVDATNNIMGSLEGYATAYHLLKASVPAIKLVKCFNSTGAENMANPVYPGPDGSSLALDMFCAGDNAEAKQVAQELATAVGFATCYDFGGDDRVALLEQFALAWINLAIFQKHGRNIGIKLLAR